MKRFSTLILVLALVLQICCPFASAAGTKFCKVCGEKIDADSVFCEYCGAKVGGKGISAPMQASSSDIDYDELAKGVLKITCSSKDGTEGCTGSGVIVFESNIIVTNYHVISDFYPIISVEADNGESVEIESIVAFDESKDLALLKLSAPTSIVPFTIGDSENLKRGDEVIAIGSPLGLLNTVSTGIVSGFTDNGGFRDIQITAPISHGSSGGALLNKNGEFIGITYSGMTDGQNLNFAIPAYEVEELYNNYNGQSEDIKAFFAFIVNAIRSDDKSITLEDDLDCIGESEASNETAYKLAMFSYNNAKYDIAERLFELLSNMSYKDSKDMYVSSSIENSKTNVNDFYSATSYYNLVQRLERKGYSVSINQKTQAKETLYNELVNEYNNHPDNGALSVYFAKLKDYKQSWYYALLNTCWCGYYLSDDDEETLFNNLNLLNTKQAILNNSYVFADFINGTWYASNGHYIKFKDDGSFSTSLPIAISGNFGVSFDNAVQYVFPMTGYDDAFRYLEGKYGNNNKANL